VPPGAEGAREQVRIVEHREVVSLGDDESLVVGEERAGQPYARAVDGRRRVDRRYLIDIDNRWATTDVPRQREMGYNEAAQLLAVCTIGETVDASDC
jgi:hypothetical protein